MRYNPKIHCQDENHCDITLCGRVDWTVVSVGGFVFERIENKHKCLQCKRKAEKGGVE